MMAPLDGRTKKGIDRQISEMARDPATVSESQALEIHKANLEVCGCLRPQVLAGLTLAQEQAAIRRVVQFFPAKDWPFETRVALVERHASRVKEAQNIKLLLEVLDPYAFTAFDPLHPCCSGLAEQKLSYKTQTFDRVLFKEVLVGLISQGTGPAAGVVLEISQLGQKHFASFDPMTAESSAVEHVKTVLSAFEFLELLLRSDVCLSHKDSGEVMGASRHKCNNRQGLTGGLASCRLSGNPRRCYLYGQLPSRTRSTR